VSAVRSELEKIIGRLSPDKLRLLLEYARNLENDELTAGEFAEIEAGKAEIARGEWVDWDVLKMELELIYGGIRRT
jgi:hypothetical protein